MSEMSIRYYPIDFDALQKGDEITTQQIEEFGRCTHEQEKQFRFAAMSLKDRIVKECRDRGKLFTVIITKMRIRILTDEEAALYNPRQFKQGFRRQVRSLRRLTEVNTSSLSEQQQKDHERNLLVFGKMLQAARSARAKVQAVAHQRTIPGLPPAKEGVDQK